MGFILLFLYQDNFTYNILLLRLPDLPLQPLFSQHVSSEQDTEAPLTWENQSTGCKPRGLARATREAGGSRAVCP